MAPLQTEIHTQYPGSKPGRLLQTGKHWKSLLAGLFMAGACVWTSSLQAADTLVISSISSTPSPLVSMLVLKEAYAAIGVKFVTRLYPAERALVETNEGYADGALHRIEGIEKKSPNLVRINIPINMVDIITVVKRPELQLKTWDSLRPYRLGIVRGYEQRTESMNVTKVQYDEELLPMLEFDRIDAAVFDRSDALRFLRQPEYQNLFIGEASLEQHPLYYYLNKKHLKLAPKLEKALSTMKSKGRIDAIRNNVIDIIRRGGKLPEFQTVENAHEEEMR